MNRLEFFDRFSSGENAGTKRSGTLVNVERVAENIRGKVVSYGSSSIVLIESYISPSVFHGNVKLGEIYRINDDFLRTVFYSSCAGYDKKIRPEDLLFIDVETTGLSAGAGTIIFLLGMVEIKEDGIRVKQYFLPSFSSEWLFIRELSNDIFSKKIIVTYNGKSFDYHIIKNRFVIQGYPFKDDFHLHFDLLYPARKFWKGLLEQYSLGTVEYRVLGFKRYEDVHGSEIPLLYFRFLNSGDTEIVKRIVHHNRMDLLSLVALLVRLREIIDFSINKNKRDGLLFNIGAVAGHFLNCKKLVEARKVLQRHGKSSVEIFRLGLVYKKTGEHRDAISAFLRSIEISRDLRIYLSGCVELAKIYEHVLKNYKEALNYTQKALRRLERHRILYQDSPVLYQRDYNLLIKREKRLLRKLQNQG